MVGEKVAATPYQQRLYRYGATAILLVVATLQRTRCCYLRASGLSWVHFSSSGRNGKALLISRQQQPAFQGDAATTTCQLGLVGTTFTGSGSTYVALLIQAYQQRASIQRATTNQQQRPSLKGATVKPLPIGFFLVVYVCEYIYNETFSKKGGHSKEDFDVRKQHYIHNFNLC